MADINHGIRKMTDAEEEITRLRKLLSDTNTHYAECIAERETLREENARLREILSECADDLEDAVNARYGEMSRKVMPDRYGRDMQSVVKARAAIRERGKND